ncbi:SR1 protein [Melghirimyces profundicolus]|uniref:SR1 protein n=1 Tax=Melghirimyces profundicolus TaxID=1242148 RepID=A0A2T6C9U0_9BACL|nr:GapA-binding peptide SR1P [Melghirimyces profundicolus]PTX65056.1 SR1 protein [Melghirimyces profundicolus]
MEAIVCQTCDEVITYVDGDKSGTLYGTCQSCNEPYADED